MTSSSTTERPDRIADRIRELGHELEVMPRPAGSYVPVKRAGDLVITSSISAKRGTELRHVGQVGDVIGLAEARESAVLAVINCLTVLRAELGSLERITDVVRLTGWVNSAPGFVDQHKVVDAASEFLVELYGDAGRHARAALGIAALPMNCSVGIELTVIAPAE
ncbi:RidA family protein [Propionibacteriaceae bacterium Y2011]